MAEVETTRVVAPVEQFSALPWAVWAGVMAWVVTSTTNVWVLGAVALGCWATAWTVGGPRAAVTRLVVPVSLLLAAVWTVLSVAVHRGGLGGQVVWFLPAWSTDSSGEFGGAVTTAQLHFSVARGVQALAVVAVIGLLLQVVSASGWLRFAALTSGRAARALGPMLCLGDAWAAARHDTRLARRAGFAVPGVTARATDVAERARSTADDWFAHHRAPQSSVRAFLGCAAALVIAVWWAVTAIDPEGSPDVSGIERTLLALAAFWVCGLLLHGGRLPRPHAGDLVPAAASVAVGVCWLLRERTGDADALVVDFIAVPSVPVTLVLSLLALPLLTLATGGQQRGGRTRR